MNYLYDKILIISRLCKCAENGVFALNISAVENKCVVFNIVCCAFYNRTQPTIVSLYNIRCGMEEGCWLRMGVLCWA